MPIALDRRTRFDSQLRLLTPEAFFAGEFVGLAARHGEMVADGMRFLQVPPLALTVGDANWSIVTDHATVSAVEGVADGALHLHLTPDQFSDWAQNQQSLNGMIVARELQFEPDRLHDVSCWDSLTHTLLDGWPAVDPNLAFVDRHGDVLDLHQAFTPDDHPDDIAHFLREAGYLHLRGWLDPADMDTISADMDRALPTYVEGDGKSWWATLADGRRVCVRIQEFVEHSPTTARILSSERWEQLRRAVAGGDDVRMGPVEGRCIEALFKPVGVVSGPSDVTFHRDCHLGRHMYSCSGLTIGIALTATSADNGRLHVIAGSHRVTMPTLVAQTDPYLPRIGLSTEPGDLTIHLSCTLHEATPPVTHERRVMYTGFALAPREDTVADGGAALSRLRERVTDLLREEQ